VALQPISGRSIAQLRIGVPIMDGAGGNNGCHGGGRSFDSKMVAPLTQRFGEAISTEEDLRKIVGYPNRWFTSTILNKLDRRCRDLSRRRRSLWWVQRIRPAWLTCRQREIARDS
jgi:hypothetical protein